MTIESNAMDLAELRKDVDAIIHNRKRGNLRPHEVLDSLRRKKLPVEAFPIVEPLLRETSGITYKYAIDIVGKMKGASETESAAIEKAWKHTWFDGVPQACQEAFRALLRIGGNDKRLLAMIKQSIKVDNYGIHKMCAETLMKIEGGDQTLRKWDKTIAGKCDCNLHVKLAEKIEQHLKLAGQ